jgi:hypothetical protein
MRSGFLWNYISVIMTIIIIKLSPEDICVASPFLTSAVLVDGSELASCLGRFTPWKITAGMHWIGSWVDPRPSLDVVQKRKFLSLLRFKAWLSSL